MKCRVAFKVEQLEELKQFATEKGNVNIQITEWREGYPNHECLRS